jgi:NAD(P)-dependent dehydrogenase (short-subunit alcohol dehydrogenase family)
MALDHAKEGIRANAFCPGVMEGVMVDRRREMAPDQLARRHQAEAGAPMGRAGRYDELAKSILYLASDDSAYCNGTALVADGGMIAGYSGHGVTLWSLGTTGKGTRP